MNQGYGSNNGRLGSFEELEVYKAARGFRKAMYAMTRGLPNPEKLDLASQIRRASVSLTNNIAQGHGRHHVLEQIKFNLQSRGSLQELLDDLNICEDERYLPAEALVQLKQQAWEVHRLINTWIQHLRERKEGRNMILHEETSAYAFGPNDLDDLNTERLGDLPV